MVNRKHRRQREKDLKARHTSKHSALDDQAYCLAIETEYRNKKVIPLSEKRAVEQFAKSLPRVIRDNYLRAKHRLLLEQKMQERIQQAKAYNKLITGSETTQAPNNPFGVLSTTVRNKHPLHDYFAAYEDFISKHIGQANGMSHVRGLFLNNNLITKDEDAKIKGEGANFIITNDFEKIERRVLQQNWPSWPTIKNKTPKDTEK